jgi:hypothetical protein
MIDLLRKTWFRVIISLFAGGAVTELIHISTGDPDRPRSSNLTLLYALIIFAVLSFLIKRTNKKTL